MEQKPASIDIGFMLNRVSKVATDPKGVWQTIKAEPDSISDIYMKFVFVLAAITPMCTFIGGSMIGYTNPLTHEKIHTPLVGGLVMAIVQYAIALAGIYIAATVAEFIAPKFEGKGSRVDAFKLCAYAAGPSYVAGVFSLIPFLGLLSILVGLYCIYVWYQGIEPMMEVPASRKLPFTIVTAIAIFVVMLVLSFITTMLSCGAVISM